MALRLYCIFCALAVALAAYGNLTGNYPTYGMFTGENSRRPGQRGGGFFFWGSPYRGGGGYHAK